MKKSTIFQVTETLFAICSKHPLINLLDLSVKFPLHCYWSGWAKSCSIISNSALLDHWCFTPGSTLDKGFLDIAVLVCGTENLVSKTGFLLSIKCISKAESNNSCTLDSETVQGWLFSFPAGEMRLKPSNTLIGLV